MTHDEARKRWHERDERGGEDPQLEAHLRECPACRAYVRDLQVVCDLLRGAREETADIAFSADSTVHGRSATAPPGVLRMSTLLRMAAAIGIVLLTAYFWPRTRPFREPAPVAHSEPAPADLTGYGITVRGESAHRQIVIADTASTAEVQVYWLYPPLDSEESSDEIQSEDSERSEG
jgi:hypothetical protein